MKSLKLFEGYGIESEYMIVNKYDLNIEHFTEKVLTQKNKGVLIDEVEAGAVCWSNELVDHVIEIKCNGPRPELKQIELDFYESVKEINSMLESKNAVLMPTAMHPFMSPDHEMKLWPHGQKNIYNKYHEIFSCTGHGWSNLQSVHINLPFKDEKEFEKLHAAVRLVLPFISYLSASSPVVENSWGEVPDNRLKFYEKNQAKVPSIVGSVVPEALFSFKDYKNKLEEIYSDISKYDPDKILQHQWLNSRGAIVKFDVQAIEIRLMDIQESPYMDFSLVCFIVEWIKSLVSEKLMTLEEQKNCETSLLKLIYDKANLYEDSEISSQYTSKYNSKVSGNNYKDWLSNLYLFLKPEIDPHYHKGIDIILSHGNLSKRIKKRSVKENLKSIYNNLINTLSENKSFEV